MRYRLRGIDTKRQFDGSSSRITYLSGAVDPYPIWSSRLPQSKVARHQRRQNPNGYTFYTLPNGAAVSLEILVLYLPLENLFAHGCQEFSIAEIRFDAFFRFHLELSWKQVRDALYRVNHGKLLFRHIGRGIYSWNATA